MKNKRLASLGLVAILGFGGLVVAPTPAQAARVIVECTTISGNVAYETTTGKTARAAMLSCFRAHGNAKWGSRCVKNVSLMRDGDNWYGGVTKKKSLYCGKKKANINLAGWVV